MKNTLFILITLLTFTSCINKNNQKSLNTSQTPKVILITIDGWRWQELFTGADSLLINNKEYVKDTNSIKNKFWKITAKKRREALMPFIWKKVVKIGQIYGNRLIGSNVNLTNHMHFSYPGYNEILTGKADDLRINSNNKILNPNTTILEIANNDSIYNGKVAAFGSWDVFPYIINYKRSNLPVNAGFMSANRKDISKKETFLNTLQKEIPSPWSSVRLDAFTHHYAMEYLKNKQPHLLYIAYGETDDFAHDGKYDAYLNSGNVTDHFINKLWNYTQTLPAYKNNTTFIITTDHGRGYTPIETWKHHSTNIKGCDETWLIAFGKGVSAKGEIHEKSQIYTNQIAATIAKILKISTPKNSGKHLNF